MGDAEAGVSDVSLDWLGGAGSSTGRMAGQWTLQWTGTSAGLVPVAEEPEAEAANDASLCPR